MRPEYHEVWGEKNPYTKIYIQAQPKTVVKVKRQSAPLWALFLFRAEPYILASRLLGKMQRPN